MLDRLPTELLALVLMQIDEMYWYGRNRTLYSCCLVSKHVKDVAQPILWRRVNWSKNWQTQSITRGGYGTLRGAQTRQLTLEGSYPEGRALHRMSTRSTPRGEGIQALSRIEAAAMAALSGD
jgi:hypothetical protein